MVHYRIGDDSVVLLWILLALAAIVLLISFICYRIVFYAKRETPLGPDEYDIPRGEIYEPYRDAMIGWQKSVRAMPHEDVTVTSFDRLKLWGTYYEYAPGAVTELMFHGYRGTAERDLCGGVQRAFSLGHNVLIVDQRASCRSEGHTITFGINEHRDCLTWVDFMLRRFGPEVKIILTGISMGAATVLMAAGKELPPNVIGVLADCGYSSAEAIIKKCAKQIGVPPVLAYPFIKLGAKLFGYFELEEYSPIEAMQTCRVPVIFYHGDADDFVPCEMTQENYEACSAPKRLVITPGAGHGLCYLIDPQTYLKELADFFGESPVKTAT